MSVDQQVVRFDTITNEITTPSGTSILKDTCETTTGVIQENYCQASLSDKLDMLLKNYIELKEFEEDGSDSAEYWNDSEDDLPPHKTNSAAREHFIFKEAEAAEALLSDTIRNCPELQSTCKIFVNPDQGNIRLQVNLA